MPDASSSELQHLALETFLTDHPEVEFIRLQFIDLAACLRTRVLPVRAALRLAANGAGFPVQSPIGVVVGGDGGIDMAAVKCRSDRLMPDWSSIKSCLYHPGTAAVPCCIKEAGGAGDGFRSCTRTLLRELEISIEKQHNLTALVGYEIEFCIMDWSKEKPELATNQHRRTYTLASANYRQAKVISVLEECVRILEKSDVHVWDFHDEGPGSMFEIALDPLPPLKAADALIYTLETIKTVCSNHGLYGTLYPCPFEKEAFAGLHAHVSISKEEVAESFLAGVLQSMPALMAIAMPSYDSYERLPILNEWVCWGIENKATPIREINRSRWEMRFPDGTQNPYLTMTAILHAGMAGVEKELPMKIKPLENLQFKISKETLDELNIVTPLPTSLKLALQALESDKILKDCMGVQLIDRFLAMKRAEEERSAARTIWERRKLGMSMF